MLLKICEIEKNGLTNKGEMLKKEGLELLEKFEDWHRKIELFYNEYKRVGLIK